MKFLTALVLTASTLLASCGGGGDSGTTPVNCFAGVKASTTPYPQVTMVTTKGSIVVELYPLNAPGTVANFLQYVTDGFYKNKIFHRVISNFVIQGGGFDAQLNLAANRPPIALEVCNGLSNTRGTIAMARSNDLNSATSQFYVNVVDNLTLDTSGDGDRCDGHVITKTTHCLGWHGLNQVHHVHATHDLAKHGIATTVGVQCQVVHHIHIKLRCG